MVHTATPPLPADQGATAPDAGRFVTVKLSTPIRRGETTIDEITIRKPKAGELRGLTLQEILQTDVSALLKLIPRITNPPLLAVEADELEPADLTEVTGSIRGFFMTSTERAMIDQLIAEQQPTT